MVINASPFNPFMDLGLQSLGWKHVRASASSSINAAAHGFQADFPSTVPTEVKYPWGLPGCFKSQICECCSLNGNITNTPQVMADSWSWFSSKDACWQLMVLAFLCLNFARRCILHSNMSPHVKGRKCGRTRFCRFCGGCQGMVCASAVSWLGLGKQLRKSTRDCSESSVRTNMCKSLQISNHLPKLERRSREKRI